jgi:hypothetical protein
MAEKNRGKAKRIGVVGDLFVVGDTGDKEKNVSGLPGMALLRGWKEKKKKRRGVGVRSSPGAKKLFTCHSLERMRRKRSIKKKERKNGQAPIDLGYPTV